MPATVHSAPRRAGEGARVAALGGASYNNNRRRARRGSGPLVPQLADPHVPGRLEQGHVGDAGGARELEERRAQLVLDVGAALGPQVDAVDVEHRPPEPAVQVACAAAAAGRGQRARGHCRSRRRRRRTSGSSNSTQAKGRGPGAYCAGAARSRTWRRCRSRRAPACRPA
eukprot:scaffold1031_cov461-Prasinococcus_capsulatus_cf.AAC.4